MEMLEMDMVKCIGPMEVIIKENGLMVFNMEKVTIIIIQVKYIYPTQAIEKENFRIIKLFKQNTKSLIRNNQIKRKVILKKYNKHRSLNLNYQFCRKVR